MAVVNITINGIKLQAQMGQTVYQAAAAAGIDIPVLCHHPALPPEGACRVCLVEIEKQRNLQPACTFPVTEGMVVHTHSPKVLRGAQVRAGADHLRPSAGLHDVRSDGRLPACRTWPTSTRSRGTSTPAACSTTIPSTTRTRSSRWIATSASSAGGACGRATTSTASRRSAIVYRGFNAQDRVRHGLHDGGQPVRVLRELRRGVPDRPRSGPR